MLSAVGSRSGRRWSSGGRERELRLRARPDASRGQRNRPANLHTTSASQPGLSIHHMTRRPLARLDSQQRTRAGQSSWTRCVIKERF